MSTRAGERVDRFLARETGVSRAEVQRWIAAGRVSIDGQPAEASDVVRVGARVEALPLEPPKTEVTPDATVRFDILHEDDSVIVLVKPAGLVVHPAPGTDAPTLVHGLLGRGLFRVPDGETRPGIVHRLDKGTSGVMVVARTGAAREALKAQFAAHTIDREYVAICVGVAATATHRTLHARDPHNRLRFTSRVRHAEAARVAITHVECIETLAEGAASLVRATLETGRTHQIRMHLAEAKTPVLGDPVYGRRPSDPKLAAIADELGHQALHARLLGFVHPTTRERMRFEAAPPAEFMRALSALGYSRKSFG